MSNRTTESQPYFKQETCCLCIEINRGMVIMGWVTFINAIWGLTVAVIHILEDRWIANLYLPLMLPGMLLAYFYCQWFSADTVKNRRRVVLGYQIIFYFWVLLSIAFICVVIWIPKSYLPNSYIEIDGKKHELTDEDKKTIRFYLIIFACFAGLFFSWVQYYFYSVAKRWSRIERLTSG